MSSLTLFSALMSYSFVTVFMCSTHLTKTMEENACSCICLYLDFILSDLPSQTINTDMFNVGEWREIYIIANDSYTSKWQSFSKTPLTLHKGFFGKKKNTGVETFIFRILCIPEEV